MPLPRAQFKGKADQLLRKISTANMHNSVAASILSVAKATLEFFAPNNDPSIRKTDTSLSPSNVDEVVTFMTDMLPPPSEIFVDDFFRRPLFPVTVLHEVAALFGCSEVAPEFVQSLSLSDAEKGNKRVMLHVWFCFFLECESDFCKVVIQRFKTSRGSPNPLVNATPGPIPVQHGTQDIRRNTNSPPIARHAGLLTSEVTTTPLEHNEHRRHTETLAAHEHGSNDIDPAGVHGENPERLRTHGDLLDDSRKANYVQMMFRDCKFNGDLSQDITETIRMYSICTRQYRLSQSQKADFFVHVFEGAARKFFFKNVSEYMSFADMSQVMMREYLSDARQLQVKGTLETLRLRSFMRERNLADVSEGLTKLVGHINELAPQCPPDFRSDAHKIDYLRRAVTEYQEWSRIPKQNITSQGYTFNTFVTTLHESIQNLRQIELVVGDGHQQTFGGVAPPFPDQLRNSIHTHLTQYGRNPRCLRASRTNLTRSNFRRGGPKESVGNFGEARRRKECFKCGDSNWSPAHRCAKGAVLTHARSRLQAGDSSVHIVADLVRQMEGEATQGDDTNEDDESAGTEAELEQFESLFNQPSAYEQGASEMENEAIEEIDKAVYTSHLASSLRSPSGYSSPFFELGGNRY